MQSGVPSESESVSGVPQPQVPGSVLFGSFGQRSPQSSTPSPSVSTSGTPQPQMPGAVFAGSFGHSSKMAMLNAAPAAIAAMGPIARGMEICSLVLEPHAAIVPSDLSASECAEPAAMSITPESPAGTVDWPELFWPHAATVPSLRSARVWLPVVPLAMSVTPARPAGTFAWPLIALPPHARTVPLARRATLCELPAATWTTVVAATGIVI